MSNHVIIYSCFESDSQARQVAKLLLNEKLIACANIMPAHTAIYEWEGKLAEESEVVMLAKTSKSLFDKAKSLIEKHHSYETPCIISVDIAQGNKDFLNWIDKTLK